MELFADGLKRYELEGERVLVLHWELTDPASGFYGYAPGKEPVLYCGFSPLPSSGEELWALIASLGESESRLVANFKTSLSERYDALASYANEEIDTRSPVWLLALASLMLGLEEADITSALAMERGGLKVDTFTVSVDGRPMLDGVRLLRSLASYKVAGVANDLLAFSMFESLGDYILGTLGDIATHFPAYRVLVSGNLIPGNAILRHRLEHRAGNFLFFGLEG